MSSANASGLRLPPVPIEDAPLKYSVKLESVPKPKRSLTPPFKKPVISLAKEAVSSRPICVPKSSNISTIDSPKFSNLPVKTSKRVSSMPFSSASNPALTYLSKELVFCLYISFSSAILMRSCSILVASCSLAVAISYSRFSIASLWRSSSSVRCFWLPSTTTSAISFARSSLLLFA